MSGPLGECRAFIVFDPGVAVPRVISSYGVGPIAVNVALQEFTLTPVEQVAALGLMSDANIAAGVNPGGLALVVGHIRTAPGAGYRALAIRDNGGVATRVSVVDATGALANAAANDNITLMWFRTPPGVSGVAG